MIVSAHQSQFIPWLPYFRKVALSDHFIWMDNVQFHRRGFQNRTLVASSQGQKWLSVPVVKGKQSDLIIEKQTFDDEWAKAHLHQLTLHYQKSANFDDTMAIIEPIYKVLENKQEVLLDSINWHFFSKLMQIFEIKTPVTRLKDLAITSAKSDLILDICNSLEATTYLTGTGGQDYLAENDFEENNINIQYISSIPPNYPINGAPFLAGLSIVDMMMHSPIEDIKREIHHG